MLARLQLGRVGGGERAGLRPGAGRARPARDPGQRAGSSAGPAAVPACGPLEFPCGGGECVPRGWRCDQEEDCADGSDEHGCGGPCARHHAPCASGPHCVARAQLCDGVPHCPDASDEGPDACGERPPPAPRGPLLSGLGGLPAREWLRPGASASFDLFAETLFENSCPPAQAQGREERGFCFCLHLGKKRWRGCSLGLGSRPVWRLPPSSSSPDLGVPFVPL